jgi:hypothetical protein
MPCLSANSAAAVKHCREVKMLRACKPLESNSFCAISQNREVMAECCRSYRSRGFTAKIRKERFASANLFVDSSVSAMDLS